MDRLIEIQKLALQINNATDPLIIAASAARIEEWAQEEIHNRLTLKGALSDLIDMGQDLLGE